MHIPFMTVIQRLIKQFFGTQEGLAKAASTAAATVRQQRISDWSRSTGLLPAPVQPKILLSARQAGHDLRPHHFWREEDLEAAGLDPQGQPLADHPLGEQVSFPPVVNGGQNLLRGGGQNG